MSFWKIPTLNLAMTRLLSLVLTSSGGLGDCHVCFTVRGLSGINQYDHNALTPRCVTGFSNQLPASREALNNGYIFLPFSYYI